jgi:hypothetical protein
MAAPKTGAVASRVQRVVGIACPGRSPCFPFEGRAPVATRIASAEHRAESEGVG